MNQADSVEAHVSEANVKGRSPGRNQIGAGTSEIRRMLIGRELFAETM
jgi:hypothetical protein